MLFKNFKKISEMRQSVALLIFDLDIIDMIGLFPDHVSMMLYELRVVNQFSAEIFFLLDLAHCVFIYDQKVVSKSVLDIRKYVLAYLSVLKDLALADNVTPDQKFLLIFSHAGSH